MIRLVRSRLHRFCFFGWIAAVTACSGTPPSESPGGPFAVALQTDAATQQAIIRVTGWSSSELRALRDTKLAPDIVRVSLPGSTGIPIAGTHRVTSDAVEMVPRFPLDPGREYLVRVDGGRLPAPRPGGVVESRVALPRASASATTRVMAIYPSSSTWPENTLRFYLHFSAPMSGTSAVGHVRLVDEAGTEIRDALLEVDVDLWNSEYTRRTVFFDPGRVKRGIKPNVDLGRALIAGRKYSIVVSTSWRDGLGQPLAQEFRHAFTAAPPIEAAVDPAGWSIVPPVKGTREPLVVRFPWALDEGLLHRALGVAAGGGSPLEGTITVGLDQTSWMFAPAAPWRSVPHSLIILTLLEDPAGNKVGQAFEFEMFTSPKAAETERLALPFRPR